MNPALIFWRGTEVYMMAKVDSFVLDRFGDRAQIRIADGTKWLAESSWRLAAPVSTSTHLLLTLRIGPCAASTSYSKPSRRASVRIERYFVTGRLGLVLWLTTFMAHREGPEPWPGASGGGSPARRHNPV